MTTLDIVMPEMDGVEALRVIRDEDPQARVVMISAIDQRAKLNECIQLGALDFIVKPFDKQRLLSLFQTYLSSESTCMTPLIAAAVRNRPFSSVHGQQSA